MKIWANLRHPNLLPLIGFHLSDDRVTALIVSPHMALGHVSEYLENATPKPTYLKRLQLVSDCRQPELITMLKIFARPLIRWKA